jgi:hypothetical protein
MFSKEQRLLRNSEQLCAIVLWAAFSSPRKFDRTVSLDEGTSAEKKQAKSGATRKH